MIKVAVILLGLATTASADPETGTLVQVSLSNGDRLSGPLLAQDEQSVTIDHPVLGRVRLPRIQPPAAPVAPAGGEPDDAVIVSAVDVPSPPSIWSGSAGVSLNYTNNTETTVSARISAEVKKVTDAEKFDLNGWYLIQTTNGAVTQSKAFVDGSQDWYVTDSKWLYFAAGQYLYNANQAWEHTVSPNGGVGYRFYDAPDVGLTGKIGGGFRWEYALRSVDAQLYLRADGRVNLSPSSSLNGFVQLTPAVDDFGNTQGIVQLNYAHKLDFLAPMSLTFFLQDNFETQPEAGSTSNDLTAGVGLNWAF